MSCIFILTLSEVCALPYVTDFVVPSFRDFPLLLLSSTSLFMYSGLLVIRWRFSGKSRYQHEIKVIYPSTLQNMCAVHINVIFWSSMTDEWAGSNWKFWPNPFLIVQDAPMIAGPICVLYKKKIIIFIPFNYEAFISSKEIFTLTCLLFSSSYY
jgi:hypothetical protein